MFYKLTPPLSFSSSTAEERKKETMLTPLQQAVELLKKSQNILIALPEGLNGDSFGAALALAASLKKLNKKTEIVCADAAPEKLKFLTGAAELKSQPTSLRDFVISIDTSQNRISRLRYETEDKILKIFLATPQKIEQRDIRLEPGPFYYDLIVTIDAPDLESLGPVFNASSELFFSKPILNIDHKAGNESFGAVNLVESAAAACTEIVADLLEKLSAETAIDAAMATALLTGLIAKTHSWQNAKTTPQALSLASRLITKGAEQEIIIKNLYKTKPLNCLKLLGRLLGRVDFDEAKKVIWLAAEPADFAATGTGPNDLPFILEEISDLFPSLNLSAVLWPDSNGFISALAQSKRPELLQKIALETNGSLKGERLLVKTAETGFSAAKGKLALLLNSLS